MHGARPPARICSSDGAGHQGRGAAAPTDAAHGHCCAGCHRRPHHCSGTLTLAAVPRALFATAAGSRSTQERQQSANKSARPHAREYQSEARARPPFLTPGRLAAPLAEPVPSGARSRRGPGERAAEPEGWCGSRHARGERASKAVQARHWARA